MHPEKKGPQKNSYYSVTKYFRVEQIYNGKDLEDNLDYQYRLIDSTGEEALYNLPQLKSMYSADYFQEETLTTRTNISQILKGVGQNIFTVNFNKRVKDQDIFDRLQEIDLAAVSDQELKVVIRESLKGEERTLIGYCLNPNQRDDFGRIKVQDLELQFQGTPSAFRLIDTRTINWLIYNETKYTVKKHN